MGRFSAAARLKNPYFTATEVSLPLVWANAVNYVKHRRGYLVNIPIFGRYRNIKAFLY
jgi:hypothetical protein